MSDKLKAAQEKARALFEKITKDIEAFALENPELSGSDKYAVIFVSSVDGNIQGALSGNRVSIPVTLAAASDGHPLKKQLILMAAGAILVKMGEMELGGEIGRIAMGIPTREGDKDDCDCPSCQIRRALYPEKEAFMKKSDPNVN